MLEFAVAKTSRVTIRAYDVLGREAERITDAVYTAGIHRLYWNGRNSASGVYWISMTGDGFRLVRKVILLR